MHYSTAVATIVLWATSTLAAPLDARSNPGQAIVKNNCASTVFLWSTADGVTPEARQVAPGSAYQETFRSPIGGGVAIKLSFDSVLTAGNVEQFEYTLESDTIFYDLNEIDGHPFQGQHVELTPSDSNCLQVTSAEAIQNSDPDQDQDVKSCSSDTDLTLTLC